jgi:hypothetical protein
MSLLRLPQCPAVSVYGWCKITSISVCVSALVYECVSV